MPQGERAVIEILVGVAAGVLTIALARALGAQRWMFSLGLLTLPSLYAAFALGAGDGAVAATEMTYGIPFVVSGLLFTFSSIRLSAPIVGAFWILHGVYDLVHARLLANPGVPAWYPAWCCAVDVVIGAYLVWLSTRICDANLRKA